MNALMKWVTILILMITSLGCLTFKNKYINQVEFFPQWEKLDVDIDLVDGAEINLAILKKVENYEFRINFLYEGQNLIIGKRLILIADNVENELSILKKNTSFYSSGRYGRIRERMTLKADRELLSLIFHSKSTQLKLIGDNGSLKFELEDSGKELLNNFRMESEKLFNLKY
ncbi:hypothetical protein [Leptospira stimsonii]|uniref:Lipoprotein n=1 Tax=Leptospira stimsonii TaxID=2202203 RepID=A0ABY2MU39_9LEPT|nr:hypothetical protein [Leptospira stimsonii]TGK14268.1 hypothetical protein EHO98_17445 [Leptospira stimsonii]TGM07875.1 hypothetical protein EHQ90_23270 [Leptospira stimsonii]